MTYPQPSSIDPVLNQQQFFRLKTPLASAGDIYESEVSALGFALGPDSDLASVNLSYFDAGSGLLKTATLSPDRNFAGRLDARNDALYEGPGARKARILINSNDIWDPTALPLDYDSFGAGSDTIEFLTPVLDVMQYFVGMPSVIPQRSDKVFRFQYFPIAPDPVNGVTWVAIPAYGRKSGYFTFYNRDPVNTIRTKVFGWKQSTSEFPGTQSSFTIQLFTSDILFAASDVYEYKASTDGLWDLFLVALGGGAAGFGYPGNPFPTTVTLSDDPQ